MKTKTINLYTFAELSETAKQTAIDKWYEFEDYQFLSEELTELCHNLLESRGCTFDSIELLYSLSNCQGDGLCFTGNIEKDGKRLKLSHSYRYYFASSVTMKFYDIETGEDLEEEDENLKDIYFDICKQLKSEGYQIIEYRMNFDEAEDLFEANDYTFTVNGIIDND